MENVREQPYRTGMITRMNAQRVSRRITTVVVLVAAACFAAGCGGDDSGDAAGTTTTTVTTPATEPVTTTAPEPSVTTAGTATTITIVIKNAAPEGGITRATVAKGDEVSLVVHSDVEDEVHLHGYNLATDVAAGGVGRIDFVASVPGRFEVELEQRGVHLADLTVSP